MGFNSNGYNFRDVVRDLIYFDKVSVDYDDTSISVVSVFPFGKESWWYEFQVFDRGF